MITGAVVVAGLLVAGARPPEPLEEIFPQTDVIVDAVVVAVAPLPAPPDAARGAPPPAKGEGAPAQRVTLAVKRVVRGALTLPKDRRIDVVKPVAHYAVKPGVKGPWLLHRAASGALVVLGRYGPDTWTFEKIDAKLEELAPPHLRR